MADTEKQRRQREREALEREQLQKQEYRQREERMRVQRRHEDEQRRWTDMAVKVQEQKRAKDIAEAEAKRLQLLKQLDGKKGEPKKE